MIYVSIWKHGKESSWKVSNLQKAIELITIEGAKVFIIKSELALDKETDYEDYEEFFGTKLSHD